MRVVFHIIGLAGTLASCMPCVASEQVVLGNGFRIHAERHEIEGGTVRLYDAGGVTEMPASAVVAYEQEEPKPAPPAEPLAAPPVAVTPTVQGPGAREFAVAAAKKFALPEAFVRSVMRAESDFQQTAVSPKGAIGLMQLMPDTARALGVDPRNARQNAEGGARYLRALLARYEDDPDQVLLALAAYNAGPGAVEKYHGVPPYRETREYILRILKNWNAGTESK